MIQTTPWQASLNLGFTHDGVRTIPVHREHVGPIRLQKVLWPERGNSTGCCHAILVHPPAGMAGGDQLTIAVRLDTAAHVLLTTPGSGKWYGSDGRTAVQRVSLQVADTALLEWLPQDMILFDQARVENQLSVELSGQAAFIGWDILTLGRQSRGEQFRQGRYISQFSLKQEGRLALWERLDMAGDDRWLQSPLGLAGATVQGTLWGIAPPHHRQATQLDELIERLRSHLVMQYYPITLTRLDDALVARLTGHDPRKVMDGLAAIRALLRRHWFGMDEWYPRIWRT